MGHVTQETFNIRLLDRFIEYYMTQIKKSKQIMIYIFLNRSLQSE